MQAPANKHWVPATLGRILRYPASLAPNAYSLVGVCADDFGWWLISFFSTTYDGQSSSVRNTLGTLHATNQKMTSAGTYRLCVRLTIELDSTVCVHICCKMWIWVSRTNPKLIKLRHQLATPSTLVKTGIPQHCSCVTVCRWAVSVHVKFE